MRGDAAAQVEDRQPQLGDHAGQLVAQIDQAGLVVVAALVASQVVDEVAERGDLLGDAVVDLAGQPAALLDGRDGADVAEQHGGLQPQRVVVEPALHVFEDVLGHHLRAVDDDGADGA